MSQFQAACDALKQAALAGDDLTTAREALAAAGAAVGIKVGNIAAGIEHRAAVARGATCGDGGPTFKHLEAIDAEVRGYYSQRW